MAAPLGAWEPPPPSRAFGPVPGYRYVVERMISAAGGRARWERVHTISLLVRNETMARPGLPARRWDERIFATRCGRRPCLLVRTDQDGRRVDRGFDGENAWVAVDARPSTDPEMLEAAYRRLREVEFWTFFPFCLEDRSAEIDVTGWCTIDGGRRSCWILDVLPPRRGEGWPAAPLRLLVDATSWRLAAVIHPRVPRELFPFSSTTGNFCSLQGFTLPHLREIADEEGVAGRETVVERLYDLRLDPAMFTAPRFHPR